MSLIRKSGIDGLGDVPWGVHFCIFYETKVDLLEIAVAYFKAGLESNEYCLWAISEPLTEQEAWNALSQAAPALDPEQVRRSVEIVPTREWYFEGSRPNLSTVTGEWHKRLQRALQQGYDGLRASGDMFWVESEDWKGVRAYEEELDKSVGGQPMIVLCTYPLAASRARDILEVAEAHHLTVVRRNGAWEAIEVAEPPRASALLTPREREVLTWIARGKTAWEAGEILKIAKRTVDEHSQTAVRKLGVANRTQAIAVALRDRIIFP